MSKILLSESHAIVLFPANMSGRASKYLLENYLGFDKKQVEKIKHVNSRAVAILKSYPMVVLTEKQIIPLSKF